MAVHIVLKNGKVDEVFFDETHAESADGTRESNMSKYDKIKTMDELEFVHDRRMIKLEKKKAKAIAACHAKFMKYMEEYGSAYERLK